MRNRLIRLACLLVALGWGISAQAQLALTPVGASGPPTGGALQIGTGLPLPASPGIFLGGVSSMTAGTPFWPTLAIGPNPAFTGTGATQTIMSTGGGAITVPASALTFQADGLPNPIPVFPTNNVVFQVATTISYAWPSTTANFAPGGAPGAGTIPGPPAGAGLITYSGTASNFGGPAQFAINAGPGSGSFSVPPNTMGALPIATVWLNLPTPMAPTTAGNVLLVGASNPFGVAQQGNSLAASPMSTAFGIVPLNLRTVNVPSGGTGCTMWCIGPIGTVPSSGPGFGTAALSNMATSTEGFPWTTGRITVSQPGAVGGPEVFFLSGTDMRVGGVGNLSMVAGALSQRMLSGPNSNRAWVSLNLIPEPSTALGAVGALGLLALCHGLVRRRSR